MYNSNFNKTLPEKINATMTTDEFANLYYETLNDNIDYLISRF